MTNPWDEFDQVIDMDDESLLIVLRGMRKGNKKFLDDTYWLTRLASTAAKAKQSVWRLEQEIARKDEALRFYADPDQYDCHGYACHHECSPRVESDEGHTAREALSPSPHQQTDAA